MFFSTKICFFGYKVNIHQIRHSCQTEIFQIRVPGRDWSIRRGRLTPFELGASKRKLTPKGPRPTH